MSGPTNIFVYGTLQRGEEREACWPHAPLAVIAAETLGELYDLGPYPALITGDDRVAGELWRLRPEDVAHTLQVLDEIECFGQGGVDLYVRRIVRCQTSHGEEEAYTYFLADEEHARGRRQVRADADGLCRWHRYRQCQRQ